MPLSAAPRQAARSGSHLRLSMARTIATTVTTPSHLRRWLHALLRCELACYAPAVLALSYPALRQPSKRRTRPLSLSRSHMCKAATCPLRVQSAYIEGSTYCNNCLHAWAYNSLGLLDGEAICFVENSADSRRDFTLSSIPECAPPPSATPTGDPCTVACAARRRLHHRHRRHRRRRLGPRRPERAPLPVADGRRLLQ